MSGIKLNPIRLYLRERSLNSSSNVSHMFQNTLSSEITNASLLTNMISLLKIELSGWENNQLLCGANGYNLKLLFHYFCMDNTLNTTLRLTPESSHWIHKHAICLTSISLLMSPILVERLSSFKHSSRSLKSPDRRHSLWATFPLVIILALHNGLRDTKSSSTDMKIQSSDNSMVILTTITLKPFKVSKEKLVVLGLFSLHPVAQLIPIKTLLTVSSPLPTTRSQTTTNID